MKIMGTKYCGHDSAICILDTLNKEIFAISTERVTRIKHDSMDITPIIETYDFGNIDYISHSYIRLYSQKLKTNLLFFSTLS